MFERMLIDKIEHRILVGTVMFLGIMLLVGWVAINENARMTSFEEQFEARSVERGAALFNTNCTSCHGIDGRGLVGQAPGLNNPHLFGHDYFADINRQISGLNTEIAMASAELNDVDAEISALNEEAIDPNTSDERFEEINARLSEIGNIQSEIDDLVEESGTEDISEERLAEIEVRLSELEAELLGDPEIIAQVADLQLQLDDAIAERDTIINQLSSAEAAGFPPLEILEDGTVVQEVRLGQMAWSGTLHDYLYTTLVHGRPGSENWWPSGQGGMAAWAQLGGGPLRADQVEDIVTYILNFEREWTVEDALTVQQFGVIPGSTDGPETAIADDFPGTDYETVQAITAEIANLEADPVAGEAAYSANACVGCHIDGTIGPITSGTFARVTDERLNESQFAGYTVEEYLVESIINPSAYVASGYTDGMPPNFPNNLSLQDLADIIAYLETQTE